ncbi:MAG: nucleotidyl transferase AbiEii/AbiGii toxin family protein [Treponema sp.]|nr:nucleotidyl transferase AbiEii/AbiGii toxin family protein [Treponema sp.]
MSSDKNTTSYSDYYEKKLYTLQNGVLNIVKTSGTPFYLTGGTALSRGYYKHRYSDDLDFFVNKDSDFSKYTDCVSSALSDSGYIWDTDTEFYKTAGFYTMKIHHKDFPMGLKIDFVNDVAAHFGEIQETDFFHRTDSVRNILSNKISASVRFAGKDMVDIREICLHEKFNWSEIFEEVSQKELGLEPDTVSQIIEGTPKSAFEKIKWIAKPTWEQFQSDLKTISEDMLKLSSNSLAQ